jgi:DNA-binding IclR family transcriptional regulator
MATNTTQKPTAIRSVSRAVNVLVCLSNGMNTVTDIASCCKLSKPTVYRLLQTLEDSLMATQDPNTHRYYLGPLINRIASDPQTNHHYLINCALEELTHLWNFSGETVELNIMVGLQYIRLYEIQSKFELKVVAGPDPVGPVYVGATAKVLLSQLNDNELQTALKNIKISRITEHSVISKRELMAQAKEIRQKGYAVSYGERIPDALCISAPISNYFWPVALSLVGPVNRLQPRVNETIKEVTASAIHIANTITKFLRAKGVIASEQVIRKKQPIQYP